MTGTTGKMKIDRTLAYMLIGILAFGILCQLAIVWFVSKKLLFTVGLWVGIATACVYAYHLWWSLERNLTVNADNEKGATVFSLKHSILRYLGVMLVLAGLWFMGGITAMLAGFLGVMGAKVGAYLQPLILKLTDRYRSKRTDG